VQVEAKSERVPGARVQGVRVQAKGCAEEKIVITSEARDLLSAPSGGKQIPRFARDDNLPIAAILGGRTNGESSPSPSRNAKNVKTRPSKLETGNLKLETRNSKLSFL